MLDLLYSDQFERLVPKKGVAPRGLGRTFRFNEIPLSIEYTSLCFFAIHSIPSSDSAASYKIRTDVDTTAAMVVCFYGHQRGKVPRSSPATIHGSPGRDFLFQRPGGPSRDARDPGSRPLRSPGHCSGGLWQPVLFGFPARSTLIGRSRQRENREGRGRPSFEIGTESRSAASKDRIDRAPFGGARL